MRIIYSIFLLASFIRVTGQNVFEKYAGEIKSGDLEKHVYYLASDSLEGRYTGAEGQKIAARYISNHFREYGLLPIGEGSEPYYQKFSLVKENYGVAYMKAGKKTVNNFWNFGFFTTQPKEDSIWRQQSVVFGGSGTDKEIAGISDPENKAVVLYLSSLTEYQEKVKKIHDDFGISTFHVFFRSKELRKNILNEYISSQIIMFGHEADSMKREQKYLDSLTIKSDDYIETFVLNIPILEDLLNLSKENLEKTWKEEGIEAIPEALYSKYTTAQRNKFSINSENVGGFIRGTKRPEEVVIIIAHYDHIGVNKNGEVNNGADDNASGTAAVLEIAEAFSKAVADGIEPERSILFIPVSGEELGIFGSRYYTIDPYFKLDSTVLVLNMDMIGRANFSHRKGRNFVYVSTMAGKHRKMKKLSRKMNRKYIHFKCDATPGPVRKAMWRFGSDHLYFVKKDVPAIAYFTGIHKDYHKPTDTPEKLNYENMENIARLVYFTAWEVAGSDVVFRKK